VGLLRVSHQYQNLKHNSLASGNVLKRKNNDYEEPN
jgi:hypothetical protein